MNINMGTHCYVGALSCGCGVAIVRDMPEFKKDTAHEVARLIKDGYTVTRLPHVEACAAFQFHCENYPHTSWQIRNEASIATAKAKQQGLLDEAKP